MFCRIRHKLREVPDGTIPHSYRNPTLSRKWPIGFDERDVLYRRSRTASGSRGCKVIFPQWRRGLAHAAVTIIYSEMSSRYLDDILTIPPTLTPSDVYSRSPHDLGDIWRSQTQLGVYEAP